MLHGRQATHCDTEERDVGQRECEKYDEYE